MTYFIPLTLVVGNVFFSIRNIDSVVYICKAALDIRKGEAFFKQLLRQWGHDSGITGLKAITDDFMKIWVSDFVLTGF